MIDLEPESLGNQVFDDREGATGSGGSAKESSAAPKNHLEPSGELRTPLAGAVRACFWHVTSRFARILYLEGGFYAMLEELGSWLYGVVPEVRRGAFVGAVKCWRARDELRDAKVERRDKTGCFESVELL